MPPPVARFANAGRGAGRGLAEMGFQVAIGMVARVWEVAPLEVIGSEVIPAVAGL